MKDITTIVEGALESKEYKDSVSVLDAIKLLREATKGNENIFLKGNGDIESDDSHGPCHFFIQKGYLIRVYGNEIGSELYFAPPEELENGRAYKVKSDNNGITINNYTSFLDGQHLPHPTTIAFVNFMKKEWKNLLDVK